MKGSGRTYDNGGGLRDLAHLLVLLHYAFDARLSPRMGPSQSYGVCNTQDRERRRVMIRGEGHG